MPKKKITLLIKNQDGNEFFEVRLKLLKIINWIDREIFERNSVYGTYWLFTQAEISYLCDDYDPFLASFLLRELVPDSME